MTKSNMPDFSPNPYESRGWKAILAAKKLVEHTFDEAENEPNRFAYEAKAFALCQRGALRMELCRTPVAFEAAEKHFEDGLHLLRQARIVVEG